MTSLVEYHEQHRSSLRARLGAAQTTDELLECIRDYLANLSDLSGEYVSGLTRSQARVALAVLGLMRHNLGAVSASAKQSITVSSAPARSPARKEGWRWKSMSAHHAGRPKPVSPLLNADTLAGIGTAGLIAGILTNPFVAAVAGIVCGLGAAVATHGIAHSHGAGNGTATDVGYLSKLPASTEPPSDIDVIESSLSETFKTLDTMLEEYDRLEEAARPRPVTPRLEDHPRILEFLQDLLGWYARKKDAIPEEALKTLRARLEEQLPDLLSEYRIQIKPFDPGSRERDIAAFDFEPSVGDQKLQTPQVVRPAFMKDSVLLLKGRVVEPDRDTAD
jgi:hypothetical protein